MMVIPGMIAKALYPELLLRHGNDAVRPFLSATFCFSVHFATMRNLASATDKRGLVEWLSPTK